MKPRILFGLVMAIALSALAQVRVPGPLTNGGNPYPVVSNGSISNAALSSDVQAQLAAAGTATNQVLDRTSWARFPAMGWNLWAYVTTISETNMLLEVNAAIASGAVQQGWTLFVLDDGWLETHRDGSGNLVPLTNNFPLGFKHAVDAVHALGCKVGVYCVAGGSAGQTFLNTPVMDFASIDKDAAALASWGVDYVKFDSLITSDEDAFLFYSRFTKAADAACVSNRIDHLIYVQGVACPITEAANPQAFPWMTALLNGIRLCGDADHSKLHSDAWTNTAVPSAKYPWLCGPGHYVFNNGIGGVGWSDWWTTNDTRAMAGFTAIICGEIQEAIRPTLLDTGDRDNVFINPEFSDLYRDITPTMGRMVQSNGTSEAWVRTMGDGSWLVGLWNKNTDTVATVSCDMTNIVGLYTNHVTARDIYAHTSTSFAGTISASVNPNDMMLYRVTTPIPQSADYVAVTGGASTNQVLSGSTLISGIVAASVSYTSTEPTNPCLTNLVIWLKANAQSAADGAMTNWFDSSGSGNDATNSASWPVFRTNQVNGLPAFQFYGTNWLMDKYAGGSAYTNFTLILVYKQTENTGAYAIFDKDFATQFDIELYADLRLDLHLNYTIASPGPLNSWTVGGGWHRGGGFGAWTGTATNSAINPTINSAYNNSSPSIGANRSGAYGFKGYIAELLYYERGLSDADLDTLLRTYINPKYFAPWPLTAVPTESSPVASQAYINASTNGLVRTNDVINLMSTDGFTVFSVDTNFSDISSNQYYRASSYSNGAALKTYALSGQSNGVSASGQPWSSAGFLFGNNGVADAGATNRPQITFDGATWNFFQDGMPAAFDGALGAQVFNGGGWQLSDIPGSAITNAVTNAMHLSIPLPVTDLATTNQPTAAAPQILRWDGTNMYWGAP